VVAEVGRVPGPRRQLDVTGRKPVSSAYSRNVMRPALGSTQVPFSTVPSACSAAFSAARRVLKVPAACFLPKGSRYRP